MTDACQVRGSVILLLWVLMISTAAAAESSLVETTVSRMTQRTIATGDGSTGNTDTSTRPQISGCPQSDISLTAPSGSNQVTPSWSVPTATDLDNRPIQVEKLSGPERNVSVTVNRTLREYEVTYQATDSHGHTSICRFKVKVSGMTCQGMPTAADTNGIVSCPGDYSGIQCTKMCKTGFEPDTGTTTEPVAAICGDDGEWKAENTVPSCTEKTCDESHVGALQNGEYDCDSSSGTALVGEACWAVCDAGYQVPKGPLGGGDRDYRGDEDSREEDGNRRSPSQRKRRSNHEADHRGEGPGRQEGQRRDLRSCDDDGSWASVGSAGAPQCVKQPDIACGAAYSMHFVNDISEVQNIQVEAPAAEAPSSGGRAPQVSRTEGPATGSDLEFGNNVVKYESHGENGLTSQCEQHINVELRECPFPGDIFQDGNLDFQQCRNITAGSTCSVTCKQGYTISKNTTIICVGSTDAADGTGSWTDTTAMDGDPTCTAEPCPQLKRPLNGILACDTASTCTITCDSGYQLPYGAQSSMTCDPTATEYSWVPARVPTCIETIGAIYTKAKYSFDFKVDAAVPAAEVAAIFGPEMFEPPGIFAYVSSVSEPTLATGETEYDVTVEIEYYSLCDGAVCDLETEVNAMTFDFPPELELVNLLQLEAAGYSCGFEYFPNPDSDTDCVACQRGTAYNPTSGACESCQTGEVTVGTQCRVCPTGTSLLGSKQESLLDCIPQCRAGSYSATGYEPCKKCSKGTYSSALGATSSAACQACPALTTTPGLGSNSSDACVAYDVLFNKPLRDHFMVSTEQEYGSMSVFSTVHGLVNSTFRINMGVFFMEITDRGDGNGLVVIDGLISIPTAKEEFPLGVPGGGWISLVASFNGTTPTSSQVPKFNIYIDGTLAKVIDVYIPLTIPANAPILLNVTFAATKQRQSMLVSKLKFYGQPATLVAGTEETMEPTSDLLFDLSQIEEDREKGIHLVPSRSLDEDLVSSVDPCTENPCMNGGNCTNENSKPRCNCPSGYKGRLCEKQRAAGQWASWGYWSTCSVTCGEGVRLRNRQCINLDDGEDCVGQAGTTGPCSVGICAASSCPTIDKSGLTCTIDNSEETCSLDSCANTMVQTSVRGTVTSTSCGPSTGYTWTSPVNKLPKCQEISNTPPTQISTSVELNYPGVTASEFDSATKTTIKANAIQSVPAAVQLDTVVVLSATDFSAKRRKRNTGTTVTLTFTIPITSTDDLDIAGFYADGTVSSSLLEVVTAIDALNLTASSIASDPTTLNVVINGQPFSVDASSVTYSSFTTCADGYVTTPSGFCTVCSVGTYYTSGWCVYCEVGSYQDETGRTSCKTCPTGYTTTYTGSTASTDCKDDPSFIEEEEDNKKGGRATKNVALIVSLVVVGFVIIAAVSSLVFYKFKLASKKNQSGFSGSFASLNKIRPNSAMTQHTGYSREHSIIDNGNDNAAAPPMKPRLSFTEEL